MRFGNVSSSILVAFGASALIGCATQPSDVQVPASEYGEAFTAARDVLHSYRFTLDRVDARAGVLTTQASGSAGFFTPWNRQESTFGQEWENTIHDQQRRVEIVFATTSDTETNRADPSPDLRSDQAREHASDLLEAPRDTNAHVHVVVERVYQFGWRPNTKSTALMSLTEDTQPDAPSRVVVDISDDPRLAGRIASEIRALIAKRAGVRANVPTQERVQEPIQQPVEHPVQQPVQQPVLQQVPQPATAPTQQVSE
jgi:hypothetical protein